MRKTSFKRYQSTTILDHLTASYNESTINYRWKKNYELISRYLSIYHPNVAKYVHKPWYYEPPFGIFLSDDEDDYISLKSKCAHFIPYDDIDCKYAFRTRFQKRVAIKQILLIMNEIEDKRKAVRGRSN